MSADGHNIFPNS